MALDNVRDPLQVNDGDPAIVRKPKIMLSGLRFAARREFTVRYKIVVFAIVLAFALYAQNPAPEAAPPAQLAW